MSNYPDYLQREENESLDDYHIRLFENKENYEIDNFTIANLLNKEAGTNYSESKWRKDFSQYKYWTSYFESKKGAIAPSDINYKESVEISGDGAQKSDKLIYMSEADKKNPEFLLEAHGYDSTKWELTNSKSSIWNQHNKQDGTLTLYASKITVKPLKNGFDVDKFLEKANESIFPIRKKPKSTTRNGGRLLEIPLFDLHFGVNSYDYYKETQDRIIEKIESENWDKIFFIVGQDLLHNNGFDGKTSSGTPIEQVDMTVAWENAWRFYCELIDIAQNNSNWTEVSYSIANHDDSMAWAFTKCLEARFVDVKFDTSKKVRKGFTWNKVFIGYTHGHKGANRLHENFLSDFGKQMALADIVEIHSGHLHSEKAKDKFGVLIRTLSTGAQTDDWHDQEGFVGAFKRFQLFEYSESSLDAITYI